MRARLLRMHIVEARDTVNDKRIHMSDFVRAKLLREIVLELKAMLPNTYDEAWNHPDPMFRELWRTSIKKELRSLVEVRKVWRRIKKEDMPLGRRCVKSKWCFDIKRTGLFKTRLVACGYSQIPGVDFTESYAPVINDVSWRILIISMLMNQYEARIVDVETAFLHGELEEEVYMTCPEVHGKDEVLHLIHAIYGLVQAARQWNKKMIDTLKELNFIGGYPDPCLMARRDENGVV
jgi:hypothetical protein